MLSLGIVAARGRLHGLLLAGLCLSPLLPLAVAAADQWPQWRGPSRSGAAAEGPELRDSLPPEGLEPVWLSEAIPGGGNGGWGSPAIANDRVYLFVPTRTRRDDLQLPPAKYPPLSEEERAELGEEEFREYEAQRRAENIERAAQFRFEETLYCLDLKTGETVWKASHPGKYAQFVQSVTPTVAEGRVYVLGSGRTAHCFDAESGEKLWSTTLPGEFRDEYFQSSFLVADRVAAILCGRLFALDAAAGKMRWQSDGAADAQLHSSPVLWRGGGGDDPLVICNLPGGKTEAFELRSGKRRWSLDSGAGNSTPVVSGDYLITYGSSRKRGLRCYQLASDEPRELWTYQRLADPGSTPAVSGDTIFVQGERRLACVDLATGRAHWQTTMPLSNPRYASPIVAGGQLLYAWEGLSVTPADPENFRWAYQAVVDRDGTMATVDDMRRRLELDSPGEDAEAQAEAERRWQQQVIGPGPLACSTPAIAAGRLVLRLRDRLACYDLAAER